MNRGASFLRMKRMGLLPSRQLLVSRLPSSHELQHSASFILSGDLLCEYFLQQCFVFSAGKLPPRKKEGGAADDDLYEMVLRSQVGLVLLIKNFFSRICFNAIGDFRVVFRLCVKASPSAKPFM